MLNEYKCIQDKGGALYEYIHVGLLENSPQTLVWMDFILSP